MVGFLYTIKNMHTTQEAAKILGYANDAVIRLMIKQKRLKAKKFGHVWIISKREINKFKKNKNKS